MIYFKINNSCEFKQTNLLYLSIMYLIYALQTTVNSNVTFNVIVGTISDSRYLQSESQTYGIKYYLFIV